MGEGTARVRSDSTVVVYSLGQKINNHEENTRYQLLLTNRDSESNLVLCDICRNSDARNNLTDK